MKQGGRDDDALDFHFAQDQCDGDTVREIGFA